jgi:hypothetical protein
MCVKSMPLLAVFGVLDEPKIFEFAWNASMPNVLELGVASLVVNVLRSVDPWLNEPLRSRPETVFVSANVPV